MDFLKSLVPAVISGEGPIEHGGALPKDTGPRLLRMKRLGLLVMGHTIDEDPVDPMMEVDPGIGSSRPARNGARLKGTTQLHIDAVVYMCLFCVNQLSLLIN